jgi:hypothetical protein
LFKSAQILLPHCGTFFDRYYKNYQQKSDEQALTPPPFELEVVEAALMVATSE